ncbi:F-box associated domain, type 1 [Dillenia turbinata]|uniref:F-box associated domain, type 1 n=1 Tax=Dillenia turbinata TaxID=194707 RepID=A0AAN8ZB31_9MAGN
MYDDSQVFLNHLCVNLNGIIYWGGYKKKGNGFLLATVFAFRLVNEEFFDISPPMSVHNEKMILNVSLLNESIALIAFHFDEHRTSQCFDVWVMSEGSGSNGNNRYSWTMLLKLEPPFPEKLSRLEFQRNGELICFIDRQIIILNPNSQGVKKIRVPRARGVFYYEEILISIKRASTR